MNFRFVTFIFIALVTTAARPSLAGANLTDQLGEIQNRNHVPALGAFLFIDNRITEAVAVGVRKITDLTPVSAADQFHLGSDTKAMTATLLAMFVEENKVSWTSTLGQLFPKIKSMNSIYRNVTIEMLLAHRAGLPSDLIHFENGNLWKKMCEANLDPVKGRKIFARKILSAAPSSAPGSKYEYTNAGYILVGAILEAVSGKSWESLIAGRIFKPLGMLSCGFGALGNQSETKPLQPWAHQLTEKGIEPLVADNPETLGPAGTVHCSMQDWAKFIALHLDGYNGRPRLIRSSSFAKLHTSYPGQDYTYGGWIKTDRPWAGGVVFTHDGSNMFNYATVWWAPKKNAALLAVTNIGGPSGQKAAQEAILPLIEKIK